MYNKLSLIKGKVDRDKEHQTKRFEHSRYNLDPQTWVEQSVKDLYDDFKKTVKRGAREIQSALDLYLNARNLRHDIWVGLLNRLKCIRSRDFGDINFNDFITDNLKEYNRSNDCNYNKTPDILILAHEQYILLGDVTVTKTVNASDRRKYFKYLDIEKDLISNGHKVKHLNLIIDETLSNYRGELQKFIDLEIIKPDEGKIKRAIEYHKVCQKMMDGIHTHVDDPSVFFQRLETFDRIAYEGADINIDSSILNQNQLLDTTITMPEDAIIDMVKEQVEKNADFFDNDINDAINAFDELINENKDKEFADPKSILKVTSNQKDIEIDTNHDLLLNYVSDIGFADESEIKDFILDLMPTIKQIKIMKKIYNDQANGRKATKDDKVYSVYGSYQYSRHRNNSHILTNQLNDQLSMGKRKKNVKKEPKTINPDYYDAFCEDVEKHIRYYGELSSKKAFLNDDWDSKTNFEMENSKNEKDIYDYVKKTNGAQLCHSLSNFYHRLTHIKTNLSTKDNIFVPPNGSFVAIIPKEHAPINHAKCDLPLIFISRVHKQVLTQSETYLNGVEYEYSIEGLNYIYHISKLCRLSVDKIAHWSQLGYKLVSTASYILSTCTELQNHMSETVGIMTLLITDGHQKTSEYLDLLKYIAFMPFSDVSRLSKLIKDKCNLLIKTKLDIWLLNKMRSFITELSKIDKLNAVKPKLQLFNSNVTRDSLGLSIHLPSFINTTTRHNNVSHFIEEVAMMFIIRPKQLYGSQFMDKSINSTVEWNIEFKEEFGKYGKWVTDGFENGSYPFESKFAFSRDAIYHAQQYVDKYICPDKNKILKSLNKSPLNTYMHYNCSLRGCVKSRQYRKNPTDIHTTSMEECLKYYKEKKYMDEECTALAIATDFIKSSDIMEFSMSEKEQRGGGRPIATPTLKAKACLMMIEKPEQAIGDHMPNNIIVAGKHKLKAQSDCYKNLLSSGAIKGYKKIYQLTEDQTKFSENDNFRKYYYYVSNNSLLPPNIRSLQLAALKKLEDREHLVKRIPLSMIDDPRYNNYKNKEQTGFRAIIGWPQGMLNMISTSVHAIADYWITHAYNKAYPNNKVETSGLVHSDDSWLSVACDDINDFKKFTIFRTFAKRLFCLKLNDKKVWGSKYLGELVSNYNINGNVHLSVAKSLANSFGNLMYQNWTMDVHAQVSSIQQSYRNGANLPTLIMLSTILRQQMIECYQVSGYHKDNIYDLPIDLGGYPDTSAFELGVTGVTSHYRKILESVKMNENSNLSAIILKALRLSVMYTNDKERNQDTVGNAYRTKTDLLSKFPDIENLNDNDYHSVVIPSKGEVFSCIRHIMPKSKKITGTINEINSLPFESEGIELIVTRPNKLSVALGNLKQQSSTLLYELASQKYTQSSRRLAISQSIQSSGKVIRVCDFPPMTINEMLYFIHKSDVAVFPSCMLEVALNDESDISSICESCVYRADYDMLNTDKRKIINRLPDVDDKFKTICKLKNVLLYTIDRKKGTKFLEEYGTLDEPIDVLIKDSDLIRKRFFIYFAYFKVEYACNLIMQQYLSKLKTKLWMQPYVNSDSALSFFCDLYGKTVSRDINYKLLITSNIIDTNRGNNDLINSIYTVSILNSMYEGKFVLSSISGVKIDDILNDIDFASLDNEMYLKYAICMKIYLNDNTHLIRYDNKKMYDQIYTKPQEYINGQWVGKFTALCRYGTTIVKIEGEPGDVTLTVNDANVSDILNCMNIFVKQNFRYYSYPHPNNWVTSTFWDTGFKIQPLYLTSYNSVVTMITNKSSINSVGLIIDKNLKMPITYNVYEADDFIFKDHNRVVLKQIEDSVIKVASVSQGMNCPHASSITLEPDLLDGFDNNKLLRTRIILNLTTKRFFNCSRNDVLALLKSRLPSVSSGCMIDMYVNILNSFGTLNIEPRNISSNKPIEVISYDINSGVSAAYAAEMFESTEPDDLTYLDAEFAYDDEIRTGSIYQHTNILKTLCSIITSTFSLTDIISVIKIFFKNEKFTDGLATHLDTEEEELKETIDDLYYASSYMEVDLDLLCFIIGNNLDSEEFYKKIDFRAILENLHTIPNRISYDIGNRLLKNLLYNIFDIEEQSDATISKLLSKLKK